MSNHDDMLVHEKDGFIIHVRGKTALEVEGLVTSSSGRASTRETEEKPLQKPRVM